YRRPRASIAGRTARAGRPLSSPPPAERRPAPERTAPARPETDLMEAIGVELPCLGCNQSYRVSLRSIRLSQTAMDEGCQMRHFADCPPAGFANLIDPALLAELERLVERIELAADGAGGRLVGP